MSVSPTSKTLNIGETVQLTGTKNPTSASEGTQWTSSNTGVATVSGSGLVTAKAAGTATITFKNSSSTKSASCTITVASGNIIVVSSYGLLLKYDGNGNLIWKKGVTRVAGGTDIYDYNDDISIVVPTSDGNIVAVSKYGLLLKYNSSGNLVWKKGVTRVAGGTDIYDYNDSIFTVKSTSDGSIVVVSKYGLLLKYNSSGNLVWKKGVTRVAGGTDIYDYNDSIFTVKSTSDGSIVVVSKYGLLLKYNSSGNLVWKKGVTRVAGGTDIYDYNDDISIVVPTSDGSIVVVSKYGLLLKYNNSGNLVWKKGVTRVAGGTDIYDYNDEISTVKSTSDGNIIVVSGYGLLLKYDGNGNLIWKKGATRVAGGTDIYDYNDGISIVVPTSDGNIVVVSGYGLLLKYNSSGDLVWKKGITRVAGGTDIYDYNDSIYNVIADKKYY